MTTRKIDSDRVFVKVDLPDALHRLADEFIASQKTSLSTGTSDSARPVYLLRLATTNPKGYDMMV